MGVLQHEVFALSLLRLAQHHAGEPADAVIDVHHVVARRELGEEGLAERRPLSTVAPLLGEAEDLGVGQHSRLLGVECPPLGKRAVHEGHRS